MTSKLIKAIVTKYWATRGLFYIMAKEPSERKHVYARYDRKEAGTYSIGKIGRDVFFDERQARYYVCELRKKRIKSLEKKLDKVERIQPFIMPIKKIE